MWAERDSKRTPFDPAEYLKVLRALRDAWDGLLALAFFALVAGFSLGSLAIWIGVVPTGNGSRTCRSRCATGCSTPGG